MLDLWGCKYLGLIGTNGSLPAMSIKETIIVHCNNGTAVARVLVSSISIEFWKTGLKGPGLQVANTHSLTDRARYIKSRQERHRLHPKGTNIPRARKGEPSRIYLFRSRSSAYSSIINNTYRVKRPIVPLRLLLRSPQYSVSTWNVERLLRAFAITAARCQESEVPPVLRRVLVIYCMVKSILMRVSGTVLQYQKPGASCNQMGQADKSVSVNSGERDIHFARRGRI
jgi:hypothetical protein